MKAVIYFYTFRGVHKLWAFIMMQLAHSKLNKIKGLQFYKLMGSGGGDGFKWYPDFSTYALLAVFEDERSWNEFETTKLFHSYFNKSLQTRRFMLLPFEGHGMWDGKMPFQFSRKTLNAPVAILTRAKIKWRYLFHFWKRVPRVSFTLNAYEGRIFGKGIGEWPLVYQATFSVWSHLDDALKYAYNNPLHREVIQLTRNLGWYDEEMFCRFWVLEDKILKQTSTA